MGNSHLQPEAPGRPQRTPHGGRDGTAHGSGGHCRVPQGHHDSAAERHPERRGERGLRKKHEGRVSDEELFTRLLYYGIAHLHLSQEEVALMPFGLLMDLVECHKQYNGLSKPKREVTIDDVIPAGLM